MKCSRTFQIKLLVLFVSFTLPAHSSTSPSIELKHDASSTKADQYTQFLAANYQYGKGNAQRAMQSFRSILAKKHSPFVYDPFIQLLADTGQFDVIKQLYEKKGKEFFKELFKNQHEHALILAQTYAFTGQEDKAEELFQELLKKFPDNPQIAYFTAMSYIKKNNTVKALAFLEQCLKNPALGQKHFLFLFLQSKIYLDQKKYPDALRTIEASIKMFPQFDRGWLVKAMLMEQLGNTKEAIKGYKHFLDLTGSDEQVEKQLVQLLFTEEKFDEAAEYMSRMKDNSPKYFFDLALLHFRAKKYDRAVTAINQALTQEEGFKQAQLLKVEILLADQRPRDAVSFMAGLVAKDPMSQVTLHTFLLLRKTNVPASLLVDALQELVRTHNGNLRLNAALADLHLEAGQNEQALQAYEQVYKLAQHNQFKSQVLFQIGHVHFMNKNVDKARERLLQAINHEPVYPSAYNLLAYVYAEQNDKLEQALKFANKALAKTPDRHDYLDTKGYVLLKLGKNQEAMNVFKRALELAPNDSIIEQHLKQAKYDIK
ncbi:tetratricopeptide repeat protein [Candidatus Babeliales bacterium]|nr:tetratricopeptide repeat protein [Candidatus Babeliales bacterium]